MDFFSSCLKLLREMSLTASGWGGFFLGGGGGECCCYSLYNVLNSRDCSEG